MSKCNGTDCASNGTTEHSIVCLFEHFLAYTGFASLPIDEVARLRKAYEDGASIPAPTAIPEEVHFTLDAGLAALHLTSVMFQGGATEHQKEVMDSARRWLDSAPVATDKAVCPECGQATKLIRTESGTRDVYCSRCHHKFDVEIVVTVISPPRTKGGVK